MKYNSTTALAVALLLSAQTGHAMDVNSNFSFNNGVKVYGGASVGYNGQGSACNTPFFEGSCDEGAMSYKLFGGARFNPMMGAELAYVDHGEASLKGSVGSEEAAIQNSITGYQVTGVGYLPLAPETVPNLEIVGKAGLLFWERETSTQLGSASQKTNDDGISPIFGIGAQYQFHQNMSLRGEWEHTFNTGSDSDFETDTDNYSMSIMYSTL